MNLETPPQSMTPSPEEKERSKNELIEFAQLLSQRSEAFVYNDIDPDMYAKYKATDEEYPGYTTPTDEIINRMKTEGFKVVLGRDARSGNVYVLPFTSNNIEKDSLDPKCLAPRDTDAEIIQLIELSKEAAKK